MKKKNIFTILTSLIIVMSSSFCISCKKERKVDAFNLCKQINSFFYECQENGLAKEIEDKWYSLDKEGKDIDFSTLTGKNGNVAVATYTGMEPFTYHGEKGYTGMCFDYIYRFAKEYGYSITIDEYKLTADVVAAVSTNKADIGVGPISVTDERKESVWYSRTYFISEYMCVTKEEDASTYNSFESLDGTSVGCIAGSVAREYITNNVKNPTIKEYPSIVECDLALKKGEIESYCMDSALYRYFSLTNSGTTATFKYADDEYGFIFNKFGIQSLHQLEGKKMGSILGSIYDDYVNQKIDNIDYEHYANVPAMVAALNSNKIESFVCEYNLAKEPLLKNESLYCLNEFVGKVPIAAAFPKTSKGQDLRDVFNQYLYLLETSGEMENLVNKWSGYIDNPDSVDTIIPYEELIATNGVLTISTDASSVPFSFIKENRYSGYEIEVIYDFCKTYGYGLEIENMNFNALIPSLSKNDIALASIIVSEEREESVYFSTPYYYSDLVVVCKADTNIEKENIFTKTKKSLKKTFVTEKRWKLFVNGIFNTLIICIFSIIGGAIIGTLLYLLFRNGKKISQYIIKAYNALLHGVPVVVTLMIFYYVIFGKSSLNSVSVSIICFSLIFSTSVFSMIKTGVGAIDKGQFEAAETLGYGKVQTFFKIILPQASRHFIPILKGDIVTLLKETSIAGYIAVVDLTKASDIVRSRTYEAFFPLIISAMIYFLLAYGLVFIVKNIDKFTNPHKKGNKKILKGVNVHD